MPDGCPVAISTTENWPAICQITTIQLVICTQLHRTFGYIHLKAILSLVLASGCSKACGYSGVSAISVDQLLDKLGRTVGKGSLIQIIPSKIRHIRSRLHNMKEL